MRLDLNVNLAEEIAVLLDGGKTPVVPPVPMSVNEVEPATALNIVKPLVPTAVLTTGGDPLEVPAPVSVKFVTSPGDERRALPPEVFPR
jgi:hypothetical protein